MKSIKRITKIGIIGILAFMLLTAFSPKVSTAQTTPTVWLAVDPDLATAIKAKLGNSFTYIEDDANELGDDMNRKNIVDDLPDVIIGYSDYIPKLAQKNIIQPIDEERLSGIYSTVERSVAFYQVEEYSKTSAVILDGSIALYGYPIAAQTTLIYANTELMNYGSNDINTIQGFEDIAINSNDQSNPTDKIYGFGYDQILDPILSQYYAYGGQLFQDDILDINHLIVNDDQSVTALTSVNNLINKLKLTDQGLETGSFTLFGQDQKLAMLLGSTSLYDSIIGNSSLPVSDNVKVHSMPGGAPLHSVSVMIPKTATDGAITTAKDIKDTLLESDFQKSLVSNGALPVSEEGWDSDLDSATKEQLVMSVENAIEVPHDPKWLDIEEVLLNQFTKLSKGDQDGERTALAIDIGLRILIPETAEWGALPTLPTSNTESSFFPLQFWIIVASFTSLIFLRRRRN